MVSIVSAVLPTRVQRICRSEPARADRRAPSRLQVGQYGARQYQKLTHGNLPRNQRKARAPLFRRVRISLQSALLLDFDYSTPRMGCGADSTNAFQPAKIGCGSCLIHVGVVGLTATRTRLPSAFSPVARCDTGCCCLPMHKE